MTPYMAMSKVASDFIVDRLPDWWESDKVRFPEVPGPVLNPDNGQENQSRRTRFLRWMVGFAREHRLPRYRGKYHPIERCRGILGLHWNGSLPDSVEAVPVEAEYGKGVRPGREGVEALGSAVGRMSGLEKWFASIPGRPRKSRARSVLSDP